MRTTRKPKPPPEYAPLPRGSVLLALDVSSSATGWAVGSIGGTDHGNILGFGVVKPTASWNAVRRTDCMIVHLAGILADYEVTHVCCEWQSHKLTGKRVQGLATLGQAQGAVRAHLSMTHRVELISEREWVRVGGRPARKDARREIVIAAVPRYAEKAGDPRFDPGSDCADAIGLLMWRMNLVDVNGSGQ